MTKRNGVNNIRLKSRLMRSRRNTPAGREEKEETDESQEVQLESGGKRGKRIQNLGQRGRPRTRLLTTSADSDV